MPSTLASKRNASKSTNLASSPRPYGAFFIAQILEDGDCRYHADAFEPSDFYIEEIHARAANE